jgi:hypothetical protein
MMTTVADLIDFQKAGSTNNSRRQLTDLTSDAAFKDLVEKEASLAGTTLVEPQTWVTEAKKSVIAEHEKKGIECMSIISSGEDIASQARRLRT